MVLNLLNRNFLSSLKQRLEFKKPPLSLLLKPFFTSFSSPKRAQSMANEAESDLPFYAKGEVIKGFGRGSKHLGFPTANFDEDVVSKMPSSMDNGVYYGWANVNEGPVYKMILSIGWNPFYKNEKKSVETHILNKYEEDFYGSQLKVIIVGFIRPMADYNNVDELIKAIEGDIEKARNLLETEEATRLRDGDFFNSGGKKS